MKLCIFTYERDLDLDHDIMYVDANVLNEKGVAQVVREISDFQPQLIIEREFNDGKAIYKEVYDLLPNIKKAYWCIDAHTNLIDHIVTAKQFDYVFLAQSWFIPLFQNQVNAKLFWLPLCHTQTLKAYTAWLEKPKPVRDIPLSFVGNIRSIHVDRAEYVKEFMKTMEKGEFVAVNQDYERTLNTLAKSQLTFNCSLNDDLNFRVWEALACGAGLMTDYVPDISNISNLPRYIDKIYPRKTEQRLGEVVEYPHLDATEFIKDGHTLTHRYEQILWMVRTGTQYEY